MNEILKLLGTKYTMALSSAYDCYKVRISDKHDNHCEMVFSVLEAEIAGHDVLLWTIEKCILELEEIKRVWPCNKRSEEEIMEEIMKGETTNGK